MSAQLVHSTTRITSDLYQDVRQAVLDDAAELVVSLLPSPKDTGGPDHDLVCPNRTE